MTAGEHLTQRVAIIPARGGSKRIPRKNLFELNGRPLISYPIRAAIECGLFDRIVVSTEDAEIAAIARGQGVEVATRPASLSEDMVNVPDVVRHHLQAWQDAGAAPEYYCIIYATAALIRADDLSAAWRLFEGREDVDFVVSVSDFPLHPNKALAEKDGYLRPNHPEMFVRPSQEYEELVAPNGTFHWGRTQAFLAGAGFDSARRIGYRLPYYRAVDIDVPEDLHLVERLLDP